MDRRLDQRDISLSGGWFVSACTKNIQKENSARNYQAGSKQSYQADGGSGENVSSQVCTLNNYRLRRAFVSLPN